MPDFLPAEIINSYLPDSERLNFSVLSESEISKVLDEPRQLYPLSWDETTGRINGAVEIILTGEDGTIVAIDTHGAQIISYKKDGVEFISKLGLPGQETGLYCAPNQNGDIARARAPITWPNAGDTSDNSLPMHGLAERSLLTYHKSLSTSARAVFSLTGEEMAWILSQHPDLHERAREFNKDSALFVIHELDDEGAITTTLQFYGQESSPGFHPYFNLFGMDAVECLKMQAENFGLNPEDVSAESLVNVLQTKLSELLPSMKEKGLLTKDGIPFRLDAEGKVGVAIAPLVGYTRDARIIFWTDHLGRICMEPLTSGEGALGSVDKETIKSSGRNEVKTVAWRMKGIVNL